MGRIASTLANDVIITSDNPRYENPTTIINEIREGAFDNCKIIVDRKKAIEYALSHYRNDETIIIAGKGGEKYQDIGGVKYPYSDFDVIYNFIKNQNSSQNGDGDEHYKV